MNTELARFNMIEQQIRTWNVLDAQVLDLLSVIPREEFVPEALRDVAFSDTELPIGNGKVMLAPKVQARMVQDLWIQKTENILEIGCGTGYSTALLAHRGRHVDAMDIEPALVRAAQRNLKRTATLNADVFVGDGARYTPFKTYDVIVLSGGVHAVPDRLLQHLSIGGRLFAFVGDDLVMRATFVTRTGKNDFAQEQPWDYVVPALENFATEPAFSF